MNVKKKKTKNKWDEGHEGERMIKISKSTFKKGPGERDNASKVYIDYCFKLVSVKTNC